MTIIANRPAWGEFRYTGLAVADARQGPRLCAGPPQEAFFKRNYLPKVQSQSWCKLIVPWIHMGCCTQEEFMTFHRVCTRSGRSNLQMVTGQHPAWPGHRRCLAYAECILHTWSCETGEMVGRPGRNTWRALRPQIATREPVSRPKWTHFRADEDQNIFVFGDTPLTTSYYYVHFWNSTESNIKLKMWG